MSASEFLDSALVGELLIKGEEVNEISKTPIDLHGELDPRLKLLSHSSRLTLNACPRKFQLYRLNSDSAPLEELKEREQGVTFAYGHAVGTGIASVLENKKENQVLLDMFLAWGTDLLDTNTKQKKSFWEAVFAIQKFVSLCAEGYLNDYELATYKGKPAVELSFRILLPGGYEYRGFVDAVLVHKYTGEILVLENKTTSMQPASIQYKNSGQALGYSVVLDKLFPETSSYSILYLAYYTKKREFEEFVFEKSLLQRALWLQELLLDTKKVDLYHDFGTFPMHGESCNDFFRPCEYYGLCTLSIENITKPYTEEAVAKIEEDTKRYGIVVDFFDLIDAQIAKGGDL